MPSLGNSEVAQLTRNLDPAHLFTETEDWAAFETHCRAVTKEAVADAAKATNVQDILQIAKTNAAFAKQAVWAKVLIQGVKYDNTDLFEIMFLDRVVWAAEGK